LSAANDRVEHGRVWIAHQALDLAKVERLPIENPQWAPDSKEGTASPEPRLFFDLEGERHSVSFSESEIEDCAEPAYESERWIVIQRLKETFRRLKREAR
jgi:hypothetical protein